MGINRRTSVLTGTISLISVTVLLLVPTIFPSQVFADDGNPYLVRTFFDDQGRQIDEIVVPGHPPEIKAAAVAVPEPNIAMGINVLSNVPALDWSYGCSATSAAMMAGYYDRTLNPNVYTGAANGGVFPLPTNSSTWGSTAYGGGTPVNCMECPLSATHNGVDGRDIKGHVDDYWVTFGNYGDDPFSGNWTEHSYGDCTADYMGTNQDYWNNSDGSTTFYYDADGAPLFDFTYCENYYPRKRDGCHGLRLFFESRGYTLPMLGNYNQYIYGYNGNTIGFTFAQFQSEIDAGRPVLIQVDGHTMLGYGYDTTGSVVYIHDTWDYNTHTMTWGGSYYGRQHYAVTVIRLQPPDSQTWYLNNDNVMYRGVTDKASEDVVIGASGSNIWTSDEATSTDVTFASSAWTGQVIFTSAPTGGGSPHTFTVEIGSSTDGSDFTAGGPDATLTGNGNEQVYSYTTDAASFTVTSGNYLALRITNNSGSDYNVYTGVTWSYTTSPATNPGYPVPELATIFLFGSGLTCLGGYFLIKRRAKSYQRA